VCCDLWEADIEAVREEIPTAHLVADRFQVARPYRDAAAQIRKTELQRLKKELPQAAYPKRKGCFRAFRKNAKDLSKEERKTLRGFCEYSACAKPAYDFREELTAIYEMHLSKPQAPSKILRWIGQVANSGLLCFDDFLRLLRHCWEQSTTFFVHPENSAFVEGFNNQVKVLNRRCYAILNISLTCSSVAILISLATAFWLLPPSMPNSRQFLISLSGTAYNRSL
jgi:transposase